MIVRYVLTRDILRRSTNHAVQADAKLDFVRGKDPYSAGITAWTNDGKRDLKFKGLFLGEQLSNIEPNVLVNFLLETYRPEVLAGLRKSNLKMMDPSDLSDYTDLQSGRRIPKNKIQFIEEYSQGLISFATLAFAHANPPGMLESDHQYAIAQPENPFPQDAQVENVNGHLVVSSHITKVPVNSALQNGSKKQVDLLDLEMTSYFHEIKEGDDKGKYQLELLNSDSDLAVYLVMGGSFADLNWAGRNLALGRPAALTLSERLQQGFRYAFTGDASNTNAWKAFIGIPGSTAYNNTLLDKIWGYSVIGNILSTIKNIAKLSTEYLSFAIKEVSRSVFDFCREGWQKSDTIKNPVGWFFAKAITGLGMFLSGACYYAAKFTHEVIKRVTSPERAAREADKKHKALGWCSRFFSFASYIAIAVFAPPVGIPVIGKLFGATVAANVTAAVTQTAVSGVPVAAAVVGGSVAKNQVVLNAQAKQQQERMKAVQNIFNRTLARGRATAVTAQANVAPAFASTAEATARMAGSSVKRRPSIVTERAPASVHSDDEGVYVPESAREHYDKATPPTTGWSPRMITSPKNIPKNAGGNSTQAMAPHSVDSNYSIGSHDGIRPPTPPASAAIQPFSSPQIGRGKKH